MIEHSLNYADSLLKGINDFYETRVENLEPKETKNIYSVFQEKGEEKRSRGNRITPIPVS